MRGRERLAEEAQPVVASAALNMPVAASHTALTVLTTPETWPYQTPPTANLAAYISHMSTYWVEHFLFRVCMLKIKYKLRRDGLRYTASIRERVIVRGGIIAKSGKSH
jgi:hypothetical protein